MDESAQEFLSLTATISNRLLEKISSKADMSKLRFTNQKKVLLVDCFEVVSKRGLPNEDEKDLLYEFGVSSNIRDIFAKRWIEFRTKVFPEVFPFEINTEQSYNYFEQILIMFEILEERDVFLTGCGRLEEYRKFITVDGLNLRNAYERATTESKETTAQELPMVFKTYLGHGPNEEVKNELYKLKEITDMMRKVLFQAVANTSSWNLSEYQKEHFDLVNKILLKNKMVINEQGRIEEYNPQKHELLYNYGLLGLKVPN